MPTQLKPIIHGRDHAAGGADPIPGGLGAALEWEDTGSGISGPTVAHPRFVSAYYDAGGGIPSGSEWQIPFDQIVSNDDPADADYQTAFGGYVSNVSTFSGTYFVGASNADAFQIRRSPGGLYVINAMANVYSPSAHTCTMRMTLPWAAATQGFGTGTAARDHTFVEDVVFGPDLGQRYWAHSWFCVMNEASDGSPSPFAPQPVGMYITQTTGITLTAGPPEFSLSACRLNLSGAA